MIIIKIVARNFMCYEKIDLELTNMATLITSSDKMKHNTGKSSLIQAIEFVIDCRYASESVAKKFLRIASPPHEEAFVELTFKFFDEKDGIDGIMVARRNFETIDSIIYSFKGVIKRDQINSFQYKFKIHSSAIFPFMATYWPLKFLSNIFHGLMCSISYFVGVTFMHTYGRCFHNDFTNYEEDALFERAISMQNLLIDLQKDMNLKNIIQISEICNKTFKSILGEAYNLRFMVYSEYGIDLNDLNQEHLNKNPTPIIITLLEFDNKIIYWSLAGAYIRYIVSLCVEIAIAIYYKHNIIFIKEAYMIAESHNSLMLKTILHKKIKLENKIQDENASSPNKILQKIINICSSNNIQLFIEYAGDVCVDNCKVVKCTKKDDAFQCK